MNRDSHFARKVLALAVAIVSTLGTAQGGLPECEVLGGPAKEPYRWYPSLDLSVIPFHGASGDWGPRSPINAPAPPVVHRTVRVTSASQFIAEGMIPGTRIEVGAQYIGPVILAGNVSDLDIVVPPGSTIAQLWIGRYSPESRTHRVRIRGRTPGTHSGGVVGSIVFYSNPATDLIVDGVDLNGDDGRGGGHLLQLAHRAERVAIVNVRGHGVGATFLGDSVDMVLAGNRILATARPGEVNGWPEGWGVRGIGHRLVVFDNRIDGTRYHRVRVHPGTGGTQYAWVGKNTFVDPREARIFSAVDMSGKTPQSYLSAAWAVCNQVYAHSRCIPTSFEAPHARYARLTANTFFGSINEEDQRRRQAMQGPGRDYLTGNRYFGWREPPSWDVPGDPSTIPLPALKPERFNPRAAGLECAPP